LTVSTPIRNCGNEPLSLPLPPEYLLAFIAVLGPHRNTDPRSPAQLSTGTVKHANQFSKGICRPRKKERAREIRPVEFAAEPWEVSYRGTADPRQFPSERLDRADFGLCRRHPDTRRFDRKLSFGREYGPFVTLRPTSVGS
jgi:hypothetical protein